MNEFTLSPYRTIADNSETEQIINKSRFIGRAFHVECDADAAEILAQIKKQHYDATHNCYAYVIDVNRARYSDDGEPQGTAGMPIMEVLRARGLSYTLCVVTRYFGGVLLGAGGLVRAYSGSCAQALDAAGICVATVGMAYELIMSYSLYNQLEQLLRRVSEVQDVVFMENVTVICHVKGDTCDSFVRAVTEQSAGRVLPRATGEVLMLARA